MDAIRTVDKSLATAASMQRPQPADRLATPAFLSSPFAAAQHPPRNPNPNPHTVLLPNSKFPRRSLPHIATKLPPDSSALSSAVCFAPRARGDPN